MAGKKTMNQAWVCIRISVLLMWTSRLYFLFGRPKEHHWEKDWQLPKKLWKCLKNCWPLHCRFKKKEDKTNTTTTCEICVNLGRLTFGQFIALGRHTHTLIHFEQTFLVNGHRRDVYIFTRQQFTTASIKLASSSWIHELQSPLNCLLKTQTVSTVAMQSLLRVCLYV